MKISDFRFQIGDLRFEIFKLFFKTAIIDLIKSFTSV